MMKLGDQRLLHPPTRMVNRSLFILGHQIGYAGFYTTYKKAMHNQWRPYRELREEQEKKLRQTIEFAYHNVPYYHRLFNDLHLSPIDIRRLEDLEKLPVLKKETIKKNPHAFIPTFLQTIPHTTHATGGSTGTPFTYRLSTADRFTGVALLYRGWSYGGYDLGDRMAFLAGSSLGVGGNSYLITKVHEILRNIRKLSSYDMGEEEMRYYTTVLNTFKPRFIRGYASSLYFYAKWLEEHDLTVPPPDAVFSAAEKLFPHMRKKIGEVFGCEVFDAYGLNDGGVSAYECPEHSGLHIDTERSVMEVADLDGSQVNDGSGQILATSLNNNAMPFIRYDTGDNGHICDAKCSCGRGNLLLTEILGREYEMLLTPEGKGVFGGYFTTAIFDKLPSVREFQVIQRELDRLAIHIVPDDEIDEKTLDYIRMMVRSKSEKWNVEFKIVQSIDRTRAGKYKFIINSLNDQTL